ncbi:MAG: AAA family ATPase [Spirochaetales bacterium]|nr:AAA family ATPase [Spirochaetales bacterium]
MANKLVAVVGMCGSGKSIACDLFQEKGWHYIRFGQITIDELKKAGQEITPENEKKMREGLRRDHGMAAFAILSLPKIHSALEQGPVIIDGLYSWSEYKILRESFGDRLQILCVYAPPALRYQRLTERFFSSDDAATRMRPLTAGQARARDYAEIENIEKGGPIAMADYTVINTGGVDDLKQQILALIGQI